MSQFCNLIKKPRELRFEATDKEMLQIATFLACLLNPDNVQTSIEDIKKIIRTESEMP